MNIYTLSLLLLAIVCFFLAQYVFNKNPREKINKSFMYLSLIFCVWSIQLFIYQSADTSKFATSWDRYFTIWLILPAAILHFTLIFTKKDSFLKKWYAYLLLYEPTVAFMIYNIITGNMTGQIVQTWWGWTYSIEGTDFDIVPIIYVIWGLINSVICIVLCIQYYRSTLEQKIKKQAKIILIGFTTFLLTGLITFAFDYVTNEFPDLTPHSYTVFIIFVAYGIVKYDLFKIDPSSAADHIISIMADALFLLNADFTIIGVNEAAEKMLKRSKGNIIGKSINDVLISRRSETPVSKDLKDQFNMSDQILDFEADLGVRNGRKAAISISATKVSQNFIETRGYVLICRDITDRQKYQQELEQKTKELEKINRILVGRELEMIELKKKLQNRANG